MSFEVEPNESECYVLVRHTGDTTVGDMNAARYVVKQYLERNNWEKILADVREANPKFLQTEHFQFVTTHKSELPEGIKIAVVSHPTHTALTTFAENVASQWEISLRGFVDEREAIDWLIGT
jgi:hypothetical protein